VDQRVLAKEFAGRRYDADLCAELPAGTDPCGERGEFHTCAVAGPMFSKRIDVRIGETVERDGFVFADLSLKPGNHDGDGSAGLQASPPRSGHPDQSSA
jgi:diphthamide synthase (EF-2-diphthine--ammonia ligase)